MGWNSFDCYNASVTEAEVKANADVFVRRLAPFGWEYIVVDFCWSHPNPQLQLSPDLETRPDGTVLPNLVLDAMSRQMPAPNRFPSAAQGQGFKPLGDYIHGLGLKFGLHIMRGIPRQALFDKAHPRAAHRRLAHIEPLANLSIGFAIGTFEQNMRALDERSLIPPFRHDGNQRSTVFFSQGHSTFFHALILLQPVNLILLTY